MPTELGPIVGAHLRGPRRRLLGSEQKATRAAHVRTEFAICVPKVPGHSEFDALRGAVTFSGRVSARYGVKLFGFAFGVGAKP